MSLRYGAIVLVAGAGLLAGCASEGMNDPYAVNPQMAAAAAATAEYPTTQPSSDLAATAVVDAKKGTIWIINASDQNITDAVVWVNSAFVTRVNSIPAHATVTLKNESFYNRQGQTLAGFNATVNSVQLQTNNNFYTLQGPVFFAH